MNGDVDLLDDVDEEAAVDALGEGVPDVTALVRVEGRHLDKQTVFNGLARYKCTGLF